MRASIISLVGCLINLTSATGIRVKAGQSIQAAINAAHPGSKIVVEAGTYAEQLTISKNGIELHASKGVILVPPPTPVTNGCTGLAGPDTNAGICIIGTDVKLADFVKEHRKVILVGSRVAGVRVKGFDVRGFVGLNIAIVGAKDTDVRENTVYDGTAYGMLTVGSIGTLITRNKVSSADLKFIGICMDDKSDVAVTWNSVSEYGIALCIQTNGALVAQNTATNICVGAFVDPGVVGAEVLHNHIGPSNPLCNPFFGNFSAGIVIGGGIDSEVHRNDVSGMSDGGDPVNIAAGVFIYDDPTSVATGNVVTFNNLTNNEQDILLLSAGANTIVHNDCSTPAELCV
ncbi:pectin lyase fold/virulence factor [Apodospora peruviana]|uniref:Pectin lyase fold/virulence factor n=1 Tax=Apodospora peruviana TaxID=516989 RepID=A0AAE0IDN0_9PEZI|nr:pectin lyase fold/virulence factor [Apodospora peruviana]